MIKFIKSTSNIQDYPVSNNEIVFVGRSNVGKSSLINILYGTKIAYVGKNPGKTKMLNFFSLNETSTVVDVPGYGFANRSKREIILFGKMMEEYFDNRKCIKKCVFILDVRRVPNEDDLDMLDYLKKHKLNTYIVLNKSDKLSYSQSLKAIEDVSKTIKVPKNKIISVSTTKKTNIDKLKEILDIK